MFNVVLLVGCAAQLVLAQLDTLPLSECSGVAMCGGHGDCVFTNVCSCHAGYYEDSLQGCLLRATVPTSPIATIPRNPTPMRTPAPTAILVPGSNGPNDPSMQQSSNANGMSSPLLDSTYITLLAIGGVILFLVLMLTIVGCMICRLKPDSQFATQYRASVHRVRESRHKRARNKANANIRNDELVDPNPMFKTAADLSTLMNSHSDDPGLGHLTRHPTRRFIADMGFGSAPTFDQIRPTMQMYQKIPSESSGKSAEAVALWNFVGQQPGDLSFNAGDRIELLQHAKKWWEGRCNGRVGVFPSNYVQLTRVSTTWAMPAPEAMAPPAKSMMRQSIHNGPQVPYSARAPAVARTATALYDFVGEQPGDLSFRRGEVIDLITWDDTWWEGFVGDRVGCL